VKRGASIGANATIVCGVTLGEYSFIGAGSVVTEDVKPFALIVGVPGRQIGWICQCGERLGRAQSAFGEAEDAEMQEIACEACESRYVLRDDQLERVD
jgi:UDP-2-acetamido-3-amino-2,3-dideoxy-glucuronate N-acetyltransferase